MFSSSGVLKLGDYGLARVLSSSSEKKERRTPQVSTRWYRSPEVLFGSDSYDFATDMWSIGCVFAELLTLEPVFPGDNDIDQISRIFQCLGTPDEKTWPDFVKLPDASKIEFTYRTSPWCINFIFIAVEKSFLFLVVLSCSIVFVSCSRPRGRKDTTTTIRCFQIIIIITHFLSTP